jgi:LysM domain
MTTMTLAGGSIGMAGPRPTRAGGSRGTARSGVRLTRRGRLVVVLAALVLLVVGMSVGQGSSQASDHGAVRAPHTVTVQAGETLWMLAERIAPSMDPRLVVAQIEQLNHLAGPQVMAGQQLRVPVAR